MGAFKNYILNKVLTTTSLEMVPVGTPRSRALLNDYSSLYSMAYLACEQTKARSLATLPVSVYRRNGDGRLPEHEHPVTKLLAGQANDLMTGVDLMQWAMIRKDTFGNAYIYVEWRGSKIVALWPITSGVTVDFDLSRRPGRRVRYEVSPGSNGVPAGKYFSEEIVNIKTPVSKDGIRGLSIAKLAAEEVGLSVDLERFYKSMLDNGNHHLGHVELPEGRMKPDDAESLRRAIDAKQGIGEAGKAPIFGYGAKWVTDQQTMKDASLIEQQEWVLQQVCRATCVPPMKVYDNSNSTYSNSEQARIEYATDTIMPEACAIEKAFKPCLEGAGETDLYLRFNLGGLMRGDKVSQSQYYREMVYMGAIDRNEVRSMEEFNPRDGLSKPMVALNYGLVEEDGSVTVLANDAAQPADGNQTGTTD